MTQEDLLLSSQLSNKTNKTLIYYAEPVKSSYFLIKCIHDTIGSGSIYKILVGTYSPYYLLILRPHVGE